MFFAKVWEKIRNGDLVRLGTLGMMNLPPNGRKFYPGKRNRLIEMDAVQRQGVGTCLDRDLRPAGGLCFFLPQSAAILLWCR